MMVSPGDDRSVSAKADRAMARLRRRLARSRALRLAAAAPPHCCNWDGLPGHCTGQRRPAA
jgi:hypothetical protein